MWVRSKETNTVKTKRKQPSKAVGFLYSQVCDWSVQSLTFILLLSKSLQENVCNTKNLNVNNLVFKFRVLYIYTKNPDNEGGVSL